MNAGTIPSTRPNNEGVLGQVLDHQGEQIGELRELMQLLYKRIDPVMAAPTPDNPHAPLPDDDRKEPGTPSIRSIVKAHTRDISKVNEILREILNRLEV